MDDGNEGMRVDVSAQLQDAGAGFRGDSGDTEYPRMANNMHHSSQISAQICNNLKKSVTKIVLAVQDRYNFG